MKSLFVFASLTGTALGNAVIGSHLDTKRILLGHAWDPIEVTGDHEFIAPDLEAGDQRGSCPGLNALANHGYISRDGVTSLAEAITAVNRVYGMGLDIATYLSTLATVFVGDPLSTKPGFSIGSADVRSQNVLGNVLGVLGTPAGLNGSHNLIEADSSNTRTDFYFAGDASTMDLHQFQKMYDMFAGEDVSAFDVFTQRAATRFNDSVMTNPDFYYGPWSGFVAGNAGYFFASRLFANYSLANPEGKITQDMLKKFYGVEGDGSNMTYKVGHERIPDNWYRVPVDYMIPSFNVDLVQLLTRHPERLSIGGNTGSVNSFVGVDFSDITGGVLDSTNLLENNNLLCFSFEVVRTFAPGMLSNVYSTVAGPLEMLMDALRSTILDTSCPAFQDMTMGGKPLNEGLQDRFPGAKKSGHAL